MGFNFEDLDQKQFVDLSKELTDLSKMLSGLKRSISPQTTNNEHPTTNAFTLIELMVAVGILAIILSFAGVIFNASIDTHRTAIANAEIMRKLRAITDQLDADFRGTIQTYPGRIDVETAADINADRIAFLATGDFQSTGQYAGMTAAGFVASIFYGQAADADPLMDPNTDPFTGIPKEKILTRIQTILTADSSLPDTDSNPRGEYCKLSLAQWQAIPPFADMNEWSARVPLDPVEEKDLVMYMAKGVDNFTIERFAGIDSTGKINWLHGETNKISTKALKFTFTLFDSKGIIKQGRTFTHIVYLDN